MRYFCNTLALPTASASLALPRLICDQSVLATIEIENIGPHILRLDSAIVSLVYVPFSD